MKLPTLKIDRKYRIRHAILKHLYDKVNEGPGHKTELKRSLTNAADLAKLLNISPRDFKEFHYSFHAPTDDHVECFPEPNDYRIGITEAGIIAYLDGYWIKEGEKAYHDKIYNFGRWVFPLLSFIISVTALVISIRRK